MEKSPDSKRRDFILVLHNIRSVHNTGSIFRSADAAGVNRIILSGYTPLPLDRFGVPRKDFAKVSLGAEKTIPWTHTQKLSSTLHTLKKDGWCVIAIEQDRRSTTLFEWRPKKSQRKMALLLGNEVRGLSKQVRSCVDEVLEIPMHGKKESLNVSVAAGVAMFVVREKRK